VTPILWCTVGGGGSRRAPKPQPHSWGSISTGVPTERGAAVHPASRCSLPPPSPLCLPRPHPSTETLFAAPQGHPAPPSPRPPARSCHRRSPPPHSVTTHPKITVPAPTAKAAAPLAAKLSRADPSRLEAPPAPRPGPNPEPGDAGLGECEPPARPPGLQLPAGPLLRRRQRQPAGNPGWAMDLNLIPRIKNEEKQKQETAAAPLSPSFPERDQALPMAAGLGTGTPRVGCPIGVGSPADPALRGTGGKAGGTLSTPPAKGSSPLLAASTARSHFERATGRRTGDGPDPSFPRPPAELGINKSKGGGIWDGIGGKTQQRG